MPPSLVHQLSNGLTLVVLERPATHQVQVHAMMRVGSRYEAAENLGVSHFLEHVLFRGCAAHPNGETLNRAFEDAGGILDAHTGVESTEFDFTVHPDKLSAGLQVLSCFLQAPILADVEKEREILLDELAYDYNEQNHLISSAILAAELMWPEHPLGRCVGGVPTTIAALGKQDLRNHHGNYYQPQNLVLALAGRVRNEEAIALTERHFGLWAPAEAEKSQPLLPPPAATAIGKSSQMPAIKIVQDSGNQFHLNISVHAPGYNDPREMVTELLARILDDGPTSRLQRVIREELALVYHIGVSYSPYWDAGSLDISTAVSVERLPSLLQQLFSQLDTFRRHGPTADEMERARMRHFHDLDFQRDSLSAQVGRYAWPLLYGQVRSESEERAQMEEISLKALHDMAAEMFALENLHVVLVGPTDDQTEKLLNEALTLMA